MKLIVKLLAAGVAFCVGNAFAESAPENVLGNILKQSITESNTAELSAEIVNQFAFGNGNLEKMVYDFKDTADAKVANLGKDEDEEGEETVLAQTYDNANAEKLALTGLLTFQGCRFALQDIAGGADTTPFCSCTVGYSGGSLSAREFILQGYIFGAALAQTEQDRQSVIAVMQADGYTPQDLEALADKLGSQTYRTRAGLSCQIFEGQSPGRGV